MQSKLGEQDKSKTMYQSFMAKARHRNESYSKYLSYVKKGSEDTDKRLAAYYNRMAKCTLRLLLTQSM